MIIHNTIIPFGRSYIAINIFGVIFAKTRLTEEEVRHEVIHTRQQVEMLFVFFYLWYVIEWTVRLLLYRNIFKAYTSISFEREAYSNQRDKHYLRHRRFFAWTKYLWRAN